MRRGAQRSGWKGLGAEIVEIAEAIADIALMAGVEIIERLGRDGMDLRPERANDIVQQPGSR